MTLNSVTLGGRLVRDFEMITTSNGTVVAKSSIAVSGYKKEDPASFVDITIFGKGAEFATNNIAKGEEFIVEGSIKMDSWDDKNTGAKRSKLYVIANKIHKIHWPAKDEDAAPAAAAQEESPF